MMLLVFVDTHGDIDSLRKLKKKATKADLVLCAGDITIFENKQLIASDEKSQVKTQHIVSRTTSARILLPYFNPPGIVKSVQRKRTLTRIDLKKRAFFVTTYDIEKSESVNSWSKYVNHFFTYQIPYFFKCNSRNGSVIS